MLKNILRALRWWGHSPQLQHTMVDIPINCFFPPEEGRSLHFITAQSTKNMYLWAVPGVLCDGIKIWTSTYMDVMLAC